MTKRDHGIGPVPEEVSEPLRDFLNQMRRLVMGGLRSGALSGTSTAAGGSSGGASTIIIGDGGSGSYTPDLTPPPTPTGVTVSTGFASVFFQTDEPTFTQGNGYQRTYVYGATYSAGTGPLPTFSSAVKVHEFVGAVGSMPANLGTQWHFWLKWLSNDDVLSTSPSGGANGHQVTIGKIGHSDLGPLIVEADNLADGTVTAAKVAAQAISLTNFANGIEPVSVVSSLPGALTTRSVFLTTDGKLYRWNGSAYVASVPAVDVTGQLTDSQLAAISAAKLTGQITSTQITDGAISTPKLAAGAVTANELAANAVTADKILANAVTAGKIAAGAVGADQIAAGAVTTGKLLVTGRGKALNDDPGCSDASAWTQTAGSTPAEFIAEATAPYGTRVIKATGQTAMTSRVFPVVAGTRYKVSAQVRKLSGIGTLYVRCIFGDSTGGLINYAVTTDGGGSLEGVAVTPSWTKFSGYIVAGTGAKTGTLEISLNWGGSGVSEFTDFRIEEYIGADLIVDGAIIAGKIAAGAIAVGSAAIADGAIRNALIENAAVDSAKIANAAVVSAKIADAAITNAKVANAAIKLANIDVATITQLSALSAYLGSVEIATTGSLRSGATGFDAGTGWWQGIDGGAAKFYMGSSAINVIWDGTQLAVRRNGLVVAPALCYIVSASASTSTGSSATLTFKRNGEIAKSSNGGSKTTVGYWYYPTSTAAGDGMALDVINSATGASVLSTNSISGDMDVTLSVPSGGGGGTSIAFYDYIIYPHFSGAGDGFASFGRFILKARTVPV